jgi:predicted  nucleic acid-binding Zn-ribbon protein
MTILQILEVAFISWLIVKINEQLKEKDNNIMTMVSDVQAKIAELEALIVEERGQVIEAINTFATKLKEALAAAAESGQDLSVLISDLQRVEDEVRAIYEPSDAPVV